MDAFKDALLDEIDRRIKRVVAAELKGRDPSLVDQTLSPLGPRKHCAAVKRRLAEEASGKRPVVGAAIVGRRHLLSQEALAEELGRESLRPLSRARPRDEEGAAYAEVMSRYAAGPKGAQKPPAAPRGRGGRR